MKKPVKAILYLIILPFKITLEVIGLAAEVTAEIVWRVTKPRQALKEVNPWQWRIDKVKEEKERDKKKE